MAFWKPGTVAPGVDVEREEKNREKEESVIVYNANKELSLYEQRLRLPIYKNREHILYLVEKYQVVIIVGQTGCGKTTQIPQYLREAGWTAGGRVVGCTQPRRVAATSIAERVAQEMGVNLGEEVGYTIRFDDMTTKGRTSIKYMTDGMLIREMMDDPLLSNYSVLMLDEAHERSLYTDIIVGLLKKIIRKRTDLKLIISSATLDAEDFFKFFNTGKGKGGVKSNNGESDSNVTIMSIEGRMYPVDIMYLEEPCQNYLLKAYETVLEIHTKMEPGDILVFLTGQEDVLELVSRIDDYSGTLTGNAYKIMGVPLYAGLPQEQQKMIFEKAPKNTRKVVVATNIAESSVTINGIVYIIDSGFVKIKAYNAKTGSDSLFITPISKASAQQRAGRAGRVKPGKAYRLYTENEFKNLANNTIPEIQRSSLTPVILQLKALGIDNILRFDFMSPPPSNNMIRSLELLYALGALDDQGRLTEKIGNQLAEMPFDPMLGKMLMAAGTFQCSQEIATIAAMLTLQQQVWVMPSSFRKKADNARFAFAAAEGDHVTLLNLYEGFVKSHKVANGAITIL